MAHPPSVHQRAVYKWVREGNGNLILVAVAGSGKTTTILNASTMMGGDVAIAAYNNKIAKEIDTKLKGAKVGSNVRAGTFHSFGFRAWLNYCRDTRPQVERDKVANILIEQKCPEPLQEFVARLVSMAKNRAFGIVNPIEDMSAWDYMIEHFNLDASLPEGDDGLVSEGVSRAISALAVSNERCKKVVDFDDMLYAPLIHGVRMYQNHWLLVDEAQDTNPARRELAKKMLIPVAGRAIFVGDPKQAIYGFTGADNDSLDLIKEEFSCAELPLTVTYRCPKAVVQLARQYVSHITAADSAPEGVVASITAGQFASQPPEVFTYRAAMLCRSTAPIVAQAFALIRRGIACHVEGKDIGRGLINLTKKWQTNDLGVFKDKLCEYLRKEQEKFLEKKQEQKAEALGDKVATLFVIMENMMEHETVADLRGRIYQLFGDTPEGEAPKLFTFSTVHKSKGREWETVYILDRAKLMPSTMARKDWELEQEYNLIYVAITRSQGTLIDVVT